MASQFNRAEAESQLKEVAAEASYHSSGDVLNQADEQSRFAHGKFERTGSAEGLTTLPSTTTTVDGAYHIGHTDAENVGQNYVNKFSTPASHTIGSGSRSTQVLPEQVNDLGSTVQTNIIQHAVTKVSEPTVYIPPQTSSGLESVATSTNTLPGPGHSLNTSGSAFPVTTGTSNHTTSDSTRSHHGVVGHNQTLYPTTLTAGISGNPVSGVAVGTTSLGIAHTDPTTPHREAAGQSMPTSTDTTGQIKHHGILGHNQTITPVVHSGDYSGNPAAGSAVGAAQLGVPHTTRETRHPHESEGAAHPSSSHSTSEGHKSSQAETASGSTQAKKTSLLTKIKDAMSH